MEACTVVHLSFGLVTPVFMGYLVLVVFLPLLVLGQVEPLVSHGLTADLLVTGYFAIHRVHG